MKKYSFCLINFFFLINGLSLFAQNHYNIRLTPSSESATGRVCYDMQLASADGVALNLAGQNYRMYYDASKLSYDDNSHILLPEDKYTKLRIKDNIQDIDARGAGYLGFDNHLGFLNLGNDLIDEKRGGIILPSDGTWVSTANVCFRLVDTENQTADASEYGIFWARPELTQSYATAYVEVAEWISPVKTTPLKAALYFDQDLNTSSEGQTWKSQPNMYPNPTNGKLFIDYAGQEALKIQVYGVKGELVLEDQYPANTEQHSIKLDNFATGAYHVRISNEDKQIVKIIEKIQ